MAPQTTITPTVGLGLAPKPAKTVDTAKTLAGLVKTLDGLLDSAPAELQADLTMALVHVLRAQKAALLANVTALGRTMVVRHAS